MNIIKIELGKIFRSITLYVGILLSMLSGSAIIYGAYYNPDFFDLKEVQVFYGIYFMLFILIYIITESIYTEYQAGTVKYIFNNNKVLNKAIIFKLISLLLAGIILAVINILFLIVGSFILKSNVDLGMFSLKIIIGYCIYIFTLYSFTILFYSFIKRSKFTLLILMFLFYLSNGIIRIIAFKYEISEKVLDFIPFYSIQGLLTVVHFNGTVILGSMVFGIIALAIGWYIIYKEDVI